MWALEICLGQIKVGGKKWASKLDQHIKFMTLSCIVLTWTKAIALSIKNAQWVWTPRPLKREVFNHFIQLAKVVMCLCLRTSLPLHTETPPETQMKWLKSRLSHSWTQEATLPSNLQHDIHPSPSRTYFWYFIGKKEDLTFHRHISHTHRVEALSICCWLCSGYWKGRSLKLQSPGNREKTLIHYSSMLSSYKRWICGAQSMFLH